MSPNFQALCYLSAWDRDLPLEGGLAWKSELREAGLDYSWTSLERIDAFLDSMRQQHGITRESAFADQSVVNVLFLLAFYIAELRSRVTGTPARWLTYDQAIEEDPNSRPFGRGFESTLIEERFTARLGKTLFLPLAAVAERLFEVDFEKSVAFSAGMSIEPPADKDRRHKPLVAESLVTELQAKYALAHIAPVYRRKIESPIPEGMSADDALKRLQTDARKLLRSGRVVWGAIVQANSVLFEMSMGVTAPAEVVYDVRGNVRAMDLVDVGARLLELKSESHVDPALRDYGKHLREETSRLFGWALPSSLYPYELHVSSALLNSEVHLPGLAMALPVFPIVISDECPGSVIPLPWQLWPEEFFDQWNQVLRLKFGARAVIQQQRAGTQVPKVPPASSDRSSTSSAHEVQGATHESEPASTDGLIVAGKLVRWISGLWIAGCVAVMLGVLGPANKGTMVAGLFWILVGWGGMKFGAWLKRRANLDP